MNVFFLDTFFIVMAIVCIVGLGYSIIHSLVSILAGIAISVGMIILIGVLLAIFDSLFPKHGFLVWFILLMLTGVVVVVSSGRVYKSYWIYEAREDIAIYHHQYQGKDYYTYYSFEDMTEESRDMLMRDVIDVVIIPEGAELISTKYRNSIAYNYFVDSRQEMIPIEYDGVEASVPNGLLYRIGEKPIFGGKPVYHEKKCRI